MPFSALYGKITEFRRALFERGVFRSYDLGRPTVSVGNITVGGTGKTPFVAHVAAILIEKGERVAIISRGYKRADPGSRVVVCDGEKLLADARSGGDEPVEMAVALGLKAIVIADADRVAAARFVIERFAPTVFILDDAFQHMRARRDLDIVLIDAANPFGNCRTLPGGILREPLDGLKRAGLIVITRANLIDQATLEKIQTDIGRYVSCPILVSRNEFSAFATVDGAPAERPIESRVFAFCAIGNPANFFDQLRNEGFETVGTKAFGDHHYYSQADADAICKEARSAGADVLITTAKDAVKLREINVDLPCLVARNEMKIDGGIEEALKSMIP